MIIKKAYKAEFRQLLAVLRLAVLDNRAYVAFPKKKFNYSEILRSLCAAGFIESYEDRREIVIINLKQTYWKSFQVPVHAFSTIEALRVNKKCSITAKQVTRQQLRQGQVPHIYISSDRGVISGTEIAAKKIGGIPLFKIY